VDAHELPVNAVPKHGVVWVSLVRQVGLMQEMTVLTVLTVLTVHPVNTWIPRDQSTPMSGVAAAVGLRVLHVAGTSPDRNIHTRGRRHAKKMSHR